MSNGCWTASLCLRRQVEPGQKRRRTRIRHQLQAWARGVNLSRIEDHIGAGFHSLGGLRGVILLT